MPELIFLPDRDGVDRLSSGAGLTRMEGAADAALRDFSGRMLARGVSASADEMETAAWRGALATALLMNVWDGVGTALRILTMDEHTSPFSAMVMASRPVKERQEPLRLVLLEKDGMRRVLGLASRRKGLIPAADPGNLSELLPERVAWYDRKAKRFLDPTPMLNERDGELLVRRLHLLRVQSPEVSAFVADLVKEQGRESHAVAQYEKDALDRLFLRVRAVIGLEGEGFAALTTQEERYTAPEEEPLLRCFTDAPGLAGESLGVQTTWLWQGIPFARSSAALGLRGTNHPREQEALDAIARELSLLDEHSRRWQRDAAERIRAWLDAVGTRRVFSPVAKETIENRCHALEEAARRPQETVVLTWPWDEKSDAAKLLLRESLGEDFAFMGSPFSARLTRLEGAANALGDTALRVSCRLGEDTCLPPLSPELAACLYRVPEGQGFVSEQLYLIPEEDGDITASFLLRGTGELALVRRYKPEEVVTLAPDEVPTVAVWPCIPMADERWKAYFVYLHGAGLTVKALSEDEWVGDSPEGQDFDILRTTAYPACLTVYRGDECLGALPNALPPMAIESAGAAVIALDIGASGISAMMRLGETVEPLTGPCLLRTLLSGGDAPVAEEFMAPEEITGLLPTALLLSGGGSEAIRDGRLFAPAEPSEVLACGQALLSGSLSWRSDAAGARARELLLHQLMLQASLAALLRGASSVSWRLALPGSGGQTLWQRWIDPANALAEVVAQETGLPLNLAVRPVTWAPAYRALGAHLRDEAVRGSFVALDFSGGGTSAHLWLRTMNKPVGGYSLQGGMQALLLSAMNEHPALLTEDFADCPDEALRKDLADTLAELRHGGEALRQMDRALLLLDLLLDRHAPAMTAHMNARYAAGRMTWLQALLLEHFAMALLLTGLLLEQAAGDAMRSHLLPEELTFCLSGRGSHLLSAMPSVLENSLARFVRAAMNERHPVRSLLLRQSPESKLDVCRGLCQMSLLSFDAGEEESMPPVKTSESFAELVMRFLTLLRAAYPQVCELLHPGLFSPQGTLTVAGEASVRRAAAQRYLDGEDIPSSLSAALRDLRLPVEPIQPSAPVD
ncbi:MAG: hypothetical protein J1E43_07605 [Christensenellaceae bacterium]|nr:hypothetical protein [Christensenellaceae bacterium]